MVAWLSKHRTNDDDDDDDNGDGDDGGDEWKKINAISNESPYHEISYNPTNH